MAAARRRTSIRCPSGNNGLTFSALRMVMSQSARGVPLTGMTHTIDVFQATVAPERGERLLVHGAIAHTVSA